MKEGPRSAGHEASTTTAEDARRRHPAEPRARAKLEGSLDGFLAGRRDRDAA